MAFTRSFDEQKIRKMTCGSHAAIFRQLKEDVLAGEVFPAVRAGELHFYYRGGCLYRFADGAFRRDENYERYGGLISATAYERAKAENEAKFINRKGTETERKLLDKLYGFTFGREGRSDVVVLDIEVNLGGKHVRKCDLVLLNTKTDELMFVEGKVFSDRRVKCTVGHTPEVIGQVNLYSAAIAAERQTILTQYGEAVRILNRLFGTDYVPPKMLMEPAKLLVYQTGGGREENARYTMNIIDEKLGKGNVLWVTDGEPTLTEIWSGLDGTSCR